MSNLLVILIIVIVNNVVELELVTALAGGDDTEPVTELVLLEELLGTIHPKEKMLVVYPNQSRLRVEAIRRDRDTYRYFKYRPENSW